jgi:hypothetical protein
MPAHFAAIGNPHGGMYASPGSLEALLDLAARDEASGLGDAPWPPHFAKQEGEGKRVAPSKAKAFSDQIGEGFGAKRFRKAANRVPRSSTASPSMSGVLPETPTAKNDSETTEAPKKKPRTPKHPLLTIAQSPDKSAAEAGLARWKEKHPNAAKHLTVDDILTDRMRGSSYIWYRIRVNLRHVPEADRPAQETPDPDDDPTRI